MKTLFIEAYYNKKIALPSDVVSKLPGKLGLFASVQFARSLDDIKRQLEKEDKKVRLFKAGHAKHPGQILGCSIRKFPGVDAYLYLGDGLFHPIALALGNSRPVFIYNPFSGKLERLSQEAVRKYRQRQKTALKKFYMSENIGILVSAKPGQNRLKDALSLKKRLKKNCYILLSDDIDLQSLENFPFIDCFVNTACPRIGYDDYSEPGKPVINIEEL